MRCPICKKSVDEPEQLNPSSSFPFCSDRCKLIDLGRWLDGAYQIPVANDEERQTPAPADDEEPAA